MHSKLARRPHTWSRSHDLVTFRREIFAVAPAQPLVLLGDLSPAEAGLTGHRAALSRGTGGADAAALLGEAAFITSAAVATLEHTHLAALTTERAHVLLRHIWSEVWTSARVLTSNNRRLSLDPRALSPVPTESPESHATSRAGRTPRSREPRRCRRGLRTPGRCTRHRHHRRVGEGRRGSHATVKVTPPSANSSI